jgi:large conductance mechanosensitive channel
MIKGFREFITKGNVLDLAVGLIMGVAFGAVVASLVADVLMPIIGTIFGSPDFSTIMVGNIMIGKFLTALVNFLLVALAVYFFIVTPMNAYKKRTEKPAAAAAAPDDVRLLTEIRDLLARR